MANDNYEILLNMYQSCIIVHLIGKNIIVMLFLWIDCKKKDWRWEKFISCKDEFQGKLNMFDKVMEKYSKEEWDTTCR